MDKNFKIYKHLNIILAIIGVSFAIISYIVSKNNIMLYGIIVVLLIFNRQYNRINSNGNEKVIKLSYLSYLGLIYIFVAFALNFLFWHFNPNNIKTGFIIIPGLIIALIPQILCRTKLVQ